MGAGGGSGSVGVVVGCHMQYFCCARGDSGGSSTVVGCASESECGLRQVKALFFGFCSTLGSATAPNRNVIKQRVVCLGCGVVEDLC